MNRDRNPGSLARVLADIAAERQAQDVLWGAQEFPDGTGPAYEERAEEAKRAGSAAWAEGELTWRHVLTEEFFEALAESDPERLRAELVQTAAVAAKWIQSLDRRNGLMPHRTRQFGGRLEKLVRDRIPELIQADGRQPETRVADESEYGAFLRAKLYEEAGEYVATGEAAELADLLEVLYALASTHGIEPAGLEELRAAKAAERGAFTDRILLRQNGPRKAAEPRSQQAVRAILLDGDDLLLFRRTKPGRAPYWTTPGGRIEPDDPTPEAALRRELHEELGATVGPLHQVFTLAEETPGLTYLSTFYQCRLISMDLSLRHGPEFNDPTKGQYDVERIPCTPEGINTLDITPAPLAAYLTTNTTFLRSLTP